MLEWAKKELDKIDKDNKGIQFLVNNNILELLQVFDNQNHSGTTAKYVTDIFSRLTSGKPLTALTGEDEEWGTILSINNTQQNLRCSSVFRNNFDNSTAKDNNGNVSITFPYMPKDATKMITE